MEDNQNRFVYLDNIRNILVYNVVLLHVMQMFAYPLLFWWAVIDKESSSGFYETFLIPMDIYLMPSLLFIAALFIFPSLEKSTPPEYIKKRFLRLCVPVIVFLFCAGDVFFQLLLTRLNPVSPDYLDTFLNFWRSFINLPALYLSSSQKTLNTAVFNFQHTWFLTFLFFLSLVVVFLNLPFKRKHSESKKVDSREKIILQTIIFAATLGIVYDAAMIYYVSHGINPSWIIIGKMLQFQIGKIWMLLPVFLFGLYAYKKEWLTRGDIGSWRIWGITACIPLALCILLYHIGILPVLDEIFKVIELNMQFDTKMTMPAVSLSVQGAFLVAWFLTPPVLIFLLMFFISFAKRFFNNQNAITSFCSKHSINVYILHYVPVLILQYTFLNVPIPSIVKIVLMLIIIIPACLWLSQRLVYPYPKIAIAFFVALKLIALAVGFTFYYIALLALIFISFTGAVYESAKSAYARNANELPRSKLRGIKTEQLELLTMQFLIFLFPSLLLHVFRDALLIAKLPNRVDEISLRPKLPTPKGLLYRRYAHEDLSGRYTLNRLNYLLRAIHRNSLNQKMNVILIRPDFQKPYLVTLRYLHAYVPQLFIYLFRKHHPPIFRWTYQMIQQNRYIMTLMNIFAHIKNISYKSIRSKLRGILPGEIQNQA